MTKAIKPKKMTKELQKKSSADCLSITPLAANKSGRSLMMRKRLNPGKTAHFATRAKLVFVDFARMSSAALMLNTHCVRLMVMNKVSSRLTQVAKMR